MKQPITIDHVIVQVDSQFGPEARTVLLLKFPTAELVVDLTTYQVQRIRKLNRIPVPPKGGVLMRERVEKLKYIETRSPQAKLNDAVKYALQVGCFFPVSEPKPGAPAQEWVITYLTDQ